MPKQVEDSEKVGDVTLKRKLTAKDICGAIPLKPEKPIQLFSIAGTSRRADPKETGFGTSLCFLGDFIAVNKATGEVFRSNRAYFPPVVQDMLEQALAASSEGEVEFAFDIGIEPDTDQRSRQGYKYTVKTVLPIRESDAMAAIAAKIGVKLLAGGTPTKLLPQPEPGKKK